MGKGAPSGSQADPVLRGCGDVAGAEDWFRLIVEAAPHAMLLVDAGRRIALVNQSAEALFGYPREDLVGQPVDVLLPDELRATHAESVDVFFDGPREGAMRGGRDLAARRKDGSAVPVEIALRPVDTHAGLFVLASIIDISERKRREDELRRSNAALQDFALVASHDLQEPLRLIASFTGLLAERYQGKLDEDADVFMAYTIDATRRMQRLVADVLAYSRLGSRAQRLVPACADTVLSGALRALEDAIDKSNATIRRGPMPAVMADEDHLHQLFVNVVGNAIKFRADAAPVIDISADLDGRRWRFAIKDNGIGIDMADAERIFQMFERVHERARYDGSGIGLAIARRIARDHGGDLVVESQPGQGATFSFTLTPVPG
jgi:PAS domain S-box-containing protein